MDERWTIIIYGTPSGDKPVQQFIESLEIKAQSKVRDTINLLREFGVRLDLPHVKKIAGTDLWELRILGSDSIRIIYIAVTGKTFVLLHAFKKKKKKTPKKDLRTAEERLAEYRSRTQK